MSSLTLASATDRQPGRLARLAAYVWRRPTVAIGPAILLVIVGAAVFAPLITPVSPDQLNPVQRLRPPSAEAWFGTDRLGRDVYTRAVYGARVSLGIGFAVALFSGIAGLVIGLTSGFLRPVDAIVMRIMDGLMSIPSILFAIAMMALMGPSFHGVIIAITLADLPRVARLVRSKVLAVREQPYVEAAIASGTRLPALLRRHILPETLAPLVVQMTFNCASAMIIEASLSFLGAGVGPETPSWGSMIAEARAAFEIRPTLIILPGLCLSLTVLAVNLLGNSLSNAFDPRVKTRV